MEFLKPSLGHLGIDLGGGQIRVAEQDLNRAEICAVFEKMGGKGMPKHMWGYHPSNTGHPGVLPEEFPAGLPGQRAAGAVKKNVVRSLPLAKQ